MYMSRSHLFLAIFALTFVANTALASSPVPIDDKQQHAAKSLEIYKTIVEIPTVAGRGNGQTIVDYLSGELTAAGFAAKDIQSIPVEGATALVVRYPGVPNSSLRPILLLGHMDVVEALDEDWERAPFKLTEDDDFYYGRGTIDNKYGIAMLTSTFVRLKRQGFTPSRDLYLVFSGDEESSMKTTETLAYHTEQLANAEYALNSDAGGGSLNSDGTPSSYNVQSAEKIYATFELTVTNQGGHSSRPRPDNAIYDLAAALKGVQDFDFPTNSSVVTREYFKQVSQRVEGDLGDAMLTFAANPKDPAAAKMLGDHPHYMTMVRTTCVPTMLAGGHAENALPQSATATVNCRIFPGETIAGVQAQLESAVANEQVEFKLLDPYPESPTSEPRDDVMAAVRVAVDTISSGLPIIPYMSSGATDGMHFRMANIPTWGVSSAFMRGEDNFAHGLNERLPKKAFNDGLDFWTVLLKELTTPN